MPSRHPQAERILSTWAGIENLLTWVIAFRVAGDERGVHLFMHYAADRISVSDKIKMFGEIVGWLSDEVETYPELLEDLRFINEVRVQVAHSVRLEVSGERAAGYVRFRRGLVNRVDEEHVRKRVGQALRRARKVRPVIGGAAEALNLFSPSQSQP